MENQGVGSHQQKLSFPHYGPEPIALHGHFEPIIAPAESGWPWLDTPR